MKVLILSDMHLGTRASAAAGWLDGIRGLARQYDRVILNGDTLDRYEAPGCTAQAARLLRDVTDACRSRSGPPELVMGNHDPAISELQWVYLEAAQTLIFHGDCVADCTHPSKPDEQLLAAAMRRRWQELGGRPEKFIALSDAYRRAQAQHALEYPPVREPRSALNYLLHSIYPPQKPLHTIVYWRRAPGAAARLGASFDRPVRRVVVGHTHRPGRWEFDGITVFNTGSFMPIFQPHAVSAAGAEVSFGPLAALLPARAVVTVCGGVQACGLKAE